MSVHPSSLHNSKHAFTLVELLLASSVTLLLFVMLAGLAGASLDTIGKTRSSVNHHEGISRLLGRMNNDFQGMRVLKDGEVGVFHLEQNEEGWTLGIVRPEPLTPSVTAQGYLRHVIYHWDRETQHLSRAAYHSIGDTELVKGTASSSENLSLNNDLTRLEDLTPAYAGEAPFDWLDSPALRDALERAEETPLLEKVRECSIELITGSITGETLDQWSDGGELPRALRIRVTLQISPGATPGREFEFLFPIFNPVSVKE